MILLIIIVGMIVSLFFFRTMENHRKYRVHNHHESRKQKLDRLIEQVRQDDENY